MKEDNNTQEKEIKKDNDFNIIVTYAKNGQSFQAIAEEIIIRKVNEIN